MTIVRSRAPMRIGLAGGGTDVSPYPERYGGCVVNVTLAKYAYAQISASSGDISFEAIDQNKKLVFSRQGFKKISGSELTLHLALYREIMEQFFLGENVPLNVSTYSEAEAGSGLGASSTIVVAMVEAYREFFNLPLDNYSKAELAFKVERIICGQQGGRQDQYSATFGGLNFIEFGEKDQNIVHPLQLSKGNFAELESGLMLCYTGISRYSSSIIDDQSKTVFEEDSPNLSSMHAMKDEAIAVKRYLLEGKFDDFALSLRNGWESKKKTSSYITNPKIDSIYDRCIKAGALAGKISGAGGGGYLMLWIPIEKRSLVKKTLEDSSLQPKGCVFDLNPAFAWKVK